jgi:kanamycin kinase/aminoglycoside 3'-phosphotransferase-2
MTTIKSDKLARLLDGYNEAEVITGRLGDNIVRYENTRHEFIYLKSGTGVSAKSLELESKALNWLGDKGIDIPRVLDFGNIDDTYYLLISGVAGLPPYKLKDREKDELLKLSAEGLRLFHQIDLTGTDFLNNLEKDLGKIEQHLRMDVIDKEKFVQANDGKTPKEVFEYLCAEKYRFENNVLTHGDFCLPNILIEGQHYGFIDLGDCGPGDKYKDLSSMEVSIKRNYGAEWIDVFNRYYDPNLKIDKLKIKYYQYIDQFGYHLDIEKYYELTKSAAR